MLRIILLVAVGFSWVLHTSVLSADNVEQEQIEFFENRIRPVLVEHCYKCHSADAKSPKGGLLLDTRDATRRGGDSGHAVVPNELDESLLLSAIKYESFEMPPSGQLSENIIADFEAWIRHGAYDPRQETPTTVPPEIDVEEGRKFWAFQPLQNSPPPAVGDESWGANEVDRYILARLEAAGLNPVEEADREKLIRRLSLDLIGLPPTPVQIDAFVNDTSPDTYERLVDRLLLSEHFGERWGRHWLDVVRYAESMGKTRNFPFPFAWRYRDYVIASFNDDKPYDQFVREQLAGDLLPFQSDEQRDEQLIATGFLALGSHDLNQRNAAAFTMDVVGEQIDVIGRSLMGLTLACARCHDHKFDPLPTRDYYALAGILRSSSLLNGYQNRKRMNNEYRAEGQFHKLLTVKTEPQAAEPTAPQPKERKRQNDPNAVKPKQVEQARKRVQELRKQVKQLAKNDQLDPRDRRAQIAALRQNIQQKQKQFQMLKSKLAKQAKRGQPGQRLSGPLAMGVAETQQASDCPINIRGDAARRGEVVPRGFLQVIHTGHTPSIPADQSGRLQLAQWLTQADHPLTSRVMVNRVWQHLFGRGLVGTVDNFGIMGERPSHPQLLDHLSARFIQEGWSVKQLIRYVVLSRTYRLDSRHDLQNYELDPDNVLVWRMNRRRLEVESIRDAILFVSGALDLESPRGSVVQTFAIGEIGRRRNSPPENFAGFPHRSIYLPIVRTRIPTFLTTFDFPEPSEVKGQRDVTTVPTQALFMMNNPIVYRHARLSATRLLEAVPDDYDRVQYAYRSALSRSASRAQAERAVEYVRQSIRSAEFPRAPAVELAAWADVYHALMASAEFRYRD